MVSVMHHAALFGCETCDIWMCVIHRNKVNLPPCPVTDGVSLVYRLGLTREELLQQNVDKEEAEIKSDLRVPRESARPQRGPATRQRDGYFKKRSRPDLRTRARRNLYKKQEPEHGGVAKDTQSVAPDTPLYKDGEAKIESAVVGSPHLPGTSSAGSDPKGPDFAAETGAPRVQTDPDDLARASASPDRVPSLPQETVDQDPKDQKRKSFEQAASASFPEKKPRLEDRQSFRNTIESVHSEKPQPTKEEPKVPPIRVGRCLIPGCSGGRFSLRARRFVAEIYRTLLLIMWASGALYKRTIPETSLTIKGMRLFSASRVGSLG